MENMQKALIMAGSVFMFIIAISVAMFSYTTVREVNDSILTSSENNARTAEYFVAITEDTERYASRAEIVMVILSMADDDYSPDEIRVAGETFKKTDFSSVDKKNELERAISRIGEGTYSLSYSFNNYELNKPGQVIVSYNLVAG